MAYNKGEAAKLLGISRQELDARAKRAGFDKSEDYYNSIGGANAPLVKEIQKQVIELDNQIEELTPYLTLTDEEKEAFLQKAIAQITPYYDNKASEIQASLEAGKVRSAEDILSDIREVEQETAIQLEQYDLSKAETEEDFLNTLSNITATEGEDIAVKREEYKQRLETMKYNQVQQGTLTSGIGAKKRQEEEDLKSMEESIIQRKADAAEQSAETASNFTLENIALARKASEEQRIRKIGTPSEVASTQAQAMQTAGLTDMSQLGSAEELARQRSESGIVASYDSTALTDLEADKTKAGIATQQELEADERAVRDATYGAQIEKIKAEQAKKAQSISALRGYN